ncbi:MAG: cytochrome c oxidase assembly protein [Aquisalinus sp.]|nr:cytochrome c oxidase assembly protein [Aquisalinus sp.]
MRLPADKNTRTAMIVVTVVIGMVGMSFAAVPAYRIFCQITGWGGTTQRADSASGEILDRTITIRFDATTSKNLPWHFKPEQVSETLRIGETGLAYYEAENLSDTPVIGSATFNVQPAKAGLYFRKIECFCFTEQLLEPGERVSMPMTYYIDPAIAEEENLDDVTTITLSYTFYRNENAEREKLASVGGAGQAVHESR